MGPDSLASTALGRLAAWADPREVVAMTESIRLGRARTDHVSDDGVLLYLPSSKNYLHAAVGDAAARRVLAAARLALALVGVRQSPSIHHLAKVRVALARIRVGWGT